MEDKMDKKILYDIILWKTISLNKVNLQPIFKNLTNGRQVVSISQEWE